MDVHTFGKKHSVARQDSIGCHLEVYGDNVGKDRNETYCQTHSKKGTDMDFRNRWVNGRFEASIETTVQYQPLSKGHASFLLFPSPYEDLYYPRDGLASAWM
jgi:hypothetical protein